MDAPGRGPAIPSSKPLFLQEVPGFEQSTRVHPRATLIRNDFPYNEKSSCLIDVHIYCLIDVHIYCLLDCCSSTWTLQL